MKKQKVDYHYMKYEGRTLQAKREIPFEIKLSSRLLLDELCFQWNKERFINQINDSIDVRDKEEFYRITHMYNKFLQKQ